MTFATIFGLFTTVLGHNLCNSWAAHKELPPNNRSLEKFVSFVAFSILWSFFFQYYLRSKIAFLWILSNLYVNFILLFDRTENGCFMCSDVNKLVNFIGIYLY